MNSSNTQGTSVGTASQSFDVQIAASKVEQSLDPDEHHGRRSVISIPPSGQKSSQPWSQPFGVIKCVSH